MVVLLWKQGQLCVNSINVSFETNWLISVKRSVFLTTTGKAWTVSPWSLIFTNFSNSRVLYWDWGMICSACNNIRQVCSLSSELTRNTISKTIIIIILYFQKVTQNRYMAIEHNMTIEHNNEQLIWYEVFYYVNINRWKETLLMNIYR